MRRAGHVVRIGRKKKKKKKKKKKRILAGKPERMKSLGRPRRR
jgi:hypothetical protein